jgi:hypothetical protein
MPTDPHAEWNSRWDEAITNLAAAALAARAPFEETVRSIAALSVAIEKAMPREIRAALAVRRFQALPWYKRLFWWVVR